MGFLSVVTQQSSSFSASLPFMVVQLYHVDSERQHSQLWGRALPLPIRTKQNCMEADEGQIEGHRGEGVVQILQLTLV